MKMALAPLSILHFLTIAAYSDVKTGSWTNNLYSVFDSSRSFIIILCV